jgi:hypothetical protein
MTRRKDDESDDDDRDPKFSGRKGSDYDEWIKKVEEIGDAEFPCKDSSDSLWMACIGTDTFGDAAGAPGGATHPTTLARQIRDCIKLHRCALRWLCKMQSDNIVRDNLRALDKGAVNGAGVHSVSGQGVARRAWLLLESQCKVALTDGEVTKIMKEFNEVGIKATVGFTESSVIDVIRKLGTFNPRLDAAHAINEHDICVKVLTLLRECPDSAFSMKADDELNAEGASRVFVHQGTTNRSLNAIKDYFDTSWRSLFERGEIWRILTKPSLSRQRLPVLKR